MLFITRYRHLASRGPIRLVYPQPLVASLYQILIRFRY